MTRQHFTPRPLRINDRTPGLVQPEGAHPVSSRCFQCPTMAADRCTPSTIGSVTCQTQARHRPSEHLSLLTPHDGILLFPKILAERLITAWVAILRGLTCRWVSWRKALDASTVCMIGSVTCTRVTKGRVRLAYRTNYHAKPFTSRLPCQG